MKLEQTPAVQQAPVGSSAKAEGMAVQQTRKKTVKQRLIHFAGEPDPIDDLPEGRVLRRIGTPCINKNLGFDGISRRKPLLPVFAMIELARFRVLLVPEAVSPRGPSAGMQPSGITVLSPLTILPMPFDASLLQVNAFSVIAEIYQIRFSGARKVSLG